MEQSLLSFTAYGRRGGGSADKAFRIEQGGDQPSLKGEGIENWLPMRGGRAGVSRVLQRRMGRSGEFPPDTTKTLRPPPSDFNKSFLFQWKLFYEFIESSVFWIQNQRILVA